MLAAEAAEINDPDTMALATVDAHGQPSVRLVLLKGIDARGFVFYTNSHSQKAREIGANNKVSAVFHWKSLRRQVRISGHCVQVTSGEANAYFASRSRMSRIGAWASDQSAILDQRATFEQRIAAMEQQFVDTDVPRPPHWNGYRIIPHAIEFWQDMPHRLHDRTLFSRDNDCAAWTVVKLYP